MFFPLKFCTFILMSKYKNIQNFNQLINIIFSQTFT